MSIIIGVDPGSRITGYGVIHCKGNQSIHLESGCIRTAASNPGDRLKQIFINIQIIIERHHPDEAAIEQVFMHQNPAAALKLGQARGAAIVALGMPIAEYSARQVKQSVVGFGAAKKEQVQHMVQQLLSISKPLQADAADALAIALCHAHTRFCLNKMGILSSRKKTKRNSWRHIQPPP